MPVSTRRVSITLGQEESAMLRQLAKATGKTKPEIVRKLIASAYGKLVPKLKAKAGFGFEGLLPASKSPAPGKSPRKKPPARR